MPIRINFLAEHQAAEEAKRRDPVKRVQLGGTCVVLLLAAWGGYLQLRLMSANAEVDDVEARYKQIEAQYRMVRTNHSIANDAMSKLAALHQLASNRFLWASPLNALQHVAVQDVEFNALRAKQAYSLIEATPAVTNKSGTIRAKPAESQQKVVLSIEARDYSASPGDHIRLFQDAIANDPYFRASLDKAEMTGRSPLTSPSRAGSRSFVTFMLECQYPVQVRQAEFLR